MAFSFRGFQAADNKGESSKVVCQCFVW